MSKYKIKETNIHLETLCSMTLCFQAEFNDVVFNINKDKSSVTIFPSKKSKHV